MPAAGCAEAIGLPPGGAGHHNAGFVGLRLRLSDDGRVVEARVAVSSGFPALDDWARTRIKRCRFTPALRDGRPVWSSYNTSVYFDEAH
ncbi:energy transducer TonB [Roseomonas gilardii subsp. gilardii]|uniref:energy transducer TonB n=1 Tax=Roseomonas gilardii TaxID=257708 RepID=UPI001FFC1E44|nr:energy transducer TonB [Roseomonas gilardii]UPG74215.1 energy transducer TonB [Roseomonas gilardii subsp. gilardii]